MIAIDINVNIAMVNDFHFTLETHLMPKDQTVFSLLESHNLYSTLESELENRGITEEFLKQKSHEDAVQRLLVGLNTVETELDNMETDVEAEQEDSSEDEDDEDE